MNGLVAMAASQKEIAGNTLAWRELPRFVLALQKGRHKKGLLNRATPVWSSMGCVGKPPEEK